MRSIRLLILAGILGGAIGIASPISSLAQSAIITPTTSPAPDTRDIDERLKRLERLFESGSLLNLFDELQNLSAEVRELEGRVEEQEHLIERLQESLDAQILRFLEMEKDIEALESKRSSSAGEAALGEPDAVVEAVDTASAGSGSAAAADPESGDAASTSTAAASLSDNIAEQQAYQSAFALLKARRYEDASITFRQFIDDYPNGNYEGSARYWLGETHYIKREYETALQIFKQLVDRYPGNLNALRAMLKIGYIQDSLGNPDEAIRVLEGLIDRYPDSNQADLAKKRLQSIQQQRQ
ncbi:MAG: tol-pal system protein YbgF [Ectothiorhodospiraceae bacterium AqS1]|nr:tol-pal system protein YbgF [Ectothiorhodospiraceae bacterium AqS1]